MGIKVVENVLLPQWYKNNIYCQQPAMLSKLDYLRLMSNRCYVCVTQSSTEASYYIQIRLVYEKNQPYSKFVDLLSEAF